MYIDYDKLRIGDRLVRVKGGIFTKHHALYMGFHDGVHQIAENQRNVGVRYITLNQFLSKGNLVKVEYYNFNRHQQNKIINRVNKKIGTIYLLYRYNCEDFVNDILHGIPHSKQRKKAVIIGAIGLIALSLLASNAKRTERY